MFQADPRLQIGLEYNPAAHEVGPLLNYMVAFESKSSPIINFGISSDRIGTPDGPMSYYFTFAKQITPGFSPYITLNYSEFENGLNVPFGASIDLNKDFVLTPMNDGRKSHLMLTYRKSDYSASLLWVWLRHPGISLSYRF